MSKIDAETAVSYAALILADANISITAEKLQTLLKAARIEDVEPIWTTLFAKALENKDVKEILTTVNTSGPATKGQEVDKPDTDKKDGEDGVDAGEDIGVDEGEESDDQDLGNLFDL